MLRGPAPYPVSLTELDAKGRAVRTVRLRAVKRCVRQKVSSAPAFRQIVKGQAPDGTDVLIVGFSYVTGAHRTFNLEAEGAAFPNGGAEGGEPTALTSPLKGPAVSESKPYAWHLAVGCEPHPFALLYGQLKPPGASVSVATATSPLKSLSEVPIPGSLHARARSPTPCSKGCPANWS